MTKIRMTFDDWWATYWVPTEIKEIAENAWKAATAAERERWCRVIEGKERHVSAGGLLDTLRRETAAEIRREP